MFLSKNLTIFIVFINLFLPFSNSYAITIGIIVPLEHEAMNHIVLGVQESLKNIDVKINIKNAQSDANIMASIIKQMKDDETDIIMPIGTMTTQMTMANIKNKAIIGVAARIEKPSNLLFTGVNDEIPITKSIQKLKILRRIALIYSANEKIVPEIEELKNYAKQNNLALHLTMIQTLNDLSAAVRSAPEDIDCFLILKDHLVVNGINIIVKEAAKRQLPLIASDEGSVQNGASVAIGVAEKEIGIEAGLIAKEVLNGKNPKDIPYKKMDRTVIFINNKAFNNQKILSREMLKNLGMEIIEK